MGRTPHFSAGFNGDFGTGQRYRDCGEQVGATWMDAVCAHLKHALLVHVISQILVGQEAMFHGK